MTCRFRVAWSAAAAGLALVLCLTGCGPSSGEKAQARELAKVLKSLVSVSRELTAEERAVANELKITLEEQDRDSKQPGSKADALERTKDFRDRFGRYVERLVAIQKRRVEVHARIQQGRWSSPLVVAVQVDAIVQIRDQIARNDAWIELAKNVRLRAELGNVGPYPELGVLGKQLAAYLSLPPELPLGSQLRDLMEEYRFGEGDLAQ